MLDETDKRGRLNIMEEPTRTLDTPHSHARAMLRAASALQANPAHIGSRRILESGAAALTALLDSDRRPDWAWFEIVVGEDACRLPEALIRAGLALGYEQELALGLSTLEWMLEQDRCPSETMAEACEVAFAATGDGIWQARASRSPRAQQEVCRGPIYGTRSREAAA